jgi:hypothetical protein
MFNTKQQSEALFYNTTKSIIHRDEGDQGDETK